MVRLSTISPDLVVRLRRMSAAERRELAVAACEFAVSRVELQHPSIDRALSLLRQGSQLPPEDRTALETLAADLDERYFDLQDAAEDGRAGPEDFLHPFAQARAVAALLSVFHEDSLTAAEEAIYEAAMTGEHPAELLAVIDPSHAR
ncbi:MAG: hypothetical protein ACREJB_17115 [Planctomycetaceae bacterium]